MIRGYLLIYIDDTNTSINRSMYFYAIRQEAKIFDFFIFSVRCPLSNNLHTHLNLNLRVSLPSSLTGYKPNITHTHSSHTFSSPAPPKIYATKPNIPSSTSSKAKQNSSIFFCSTTTITTQKRSSHLHSISSTHPPKTTKFRHLLPEFHSPTQKFFHR